jgi:hypothetical protein
MNFPPLGSDIWRDSLSVLREFLLDAVIKLSGMNVMSSVRCSAPFSLVNASAFFSTAVSSSSSRATMVRSFLFDAYHLPLMQSLLKSKDEQLAAIAGKAVKEATYHLRASSEWVIRFGDGTD